MKNLNKICLQLLKRQNELLANTICVKKISLLLEKNACRGA